MFCHRTKIQGKDTEEKNHKKAKNGVNILYRKANDEEKKQAIREYTEKFSNPYRAAEQGFIDEVIQPRDTRFKLIQALEMAKNKSQSNPPKKHGNIPL